jgi:hypothetical protein
MENLATFTFMLDLRSTEDNALKNGKIICSNAWIPDFRMNIAIDTDHI